MPKQQQQQQRTQPRNCHAKRGLLPSALTFNGISVGSLFTGRSRTCHLTISQSCQSTGDRGEKYDWMELSRLSQ